jgi:catechol 2,3-dioxygenase-like lactoylglutathione lyase family enzyme
MSQPKSFSHLGVCVSDLDRSLRFYTEALGFEESSSFDVGPEFGRLMEVDGVQLRSRFVRRDSTSIELLCFDQPGHVGPAERRPVNQLGLTHLSFKVDDVDATAAAVERCGGTVVPDTRTTFGEGDGLLDFVYCTDPDGTRVELMRLPD